MQIFTNVKPRFIPFLEFHVIHTINIKGVN